jgi:DNA-binding CsgD family transcriptional regulator
MITANQLDRFGDLVSTIGSASFGAEFYRLFSKDLAISECTVFSFPAAARPSSLVVEGAHAPERARASRLASDYVLGGYRADPNVRGSLRGTDIKVYLASPDLIGDQDYRRHYYDDPELGHELVMLGRAGETLYYASFYRGRNERAFDASELDRVTTASRFVLKALHRHNQLVRGETDDEPVRQALQEPLAPCEQRARTLEYMRDILLSSPQGLSPREAEVCAGIVLGYTTLAISLNCGISLNTVATHRKRAYAKLGISSQNELFVCYFSTVSQFQSSFTTKRI